MRKNPINLKLNAVADGQISDNCDILLRAITFPDTPENVPVTQQEFPVKAIGEF